MSQTVDFFSFHIHTLLRYQKKIGTYEVATVVGRPTLFSVNFYLDCFITQPLLRRNHELEGIRDLRIHTRSSVDLQLINASAYRTIGRNWRSNILKHDTAILHVYFRLQGRIVVRKKLRVTVRVSSFVLRLVRPSCRSIVLASSFKDVVNFMCFKRRQLPIRGCISYLHPRSLISGKFAVGVCLQ